MTTLTDAKQYPKAEIAQLFRLRWHVELDLRNLKISLQLDDLRGKTPEMVRREIWVHWLAYNLIRKVMAQAAIALRALAARIEFRRRVGGRRHGVGPCQYGQSLAIVDLGHPATEGDRRNVASAIAPIASNLGRSNAVPNPTGS